MIFGETPAQESRRDSQERALVKEGKIAKKIIAAISAEGPMTAFELANKTGVALLTVRPLLTKLASERYLRAPAILEERGRKKVDESPIRVTVYGLAGGLL